MSRQSQHKKSSLRNKYLVISGVVVALLFAAFALITALRGTTISRVQKLSPSAYQSQFTTVNTAHLLVDVRTADEFATGHIYGALNIPLDTLESRLNEFPRNEPVIVYCRSGNRSAQASQLLANAGYTQIYDLGGINAWTEQGFPIE